MFKRSFPVYLQPDAMDCGPVSLKMIAKYYGKYVNLDTLREQSYMTRQGVSLHNLSLTAEKMGFRTVAATTDLSTLTEVTLPCIVVWEQSHYLVVYKAKGNRLLVADPKVGKLTYTKDTFVKHWTGQADLSAQGIVLLLEPTPDFYQQNHEQYAQRGWRFLLSYFKPHQAYLLQLILSIVGISIIQVLFPFLTQALVDQGIRSYNLSIIYIILIAQLMLFISQTGAEIIRSFLLLHVGHRISLSILSDYLSKLLKLPVSFFEKKNIGDILQRIDDNVKVEDFLTNTALTLLFSVLQLLVFGTLLAFFHLSIFLVFLAASLLYILWMYLFSKARLRLEGQRFHTTKQNLVDTHQLIYGIQEIRLNGSERRRRWKWEEGRVKLFQIASKVLSTEQAQLRGGTFLSELKNIIITVIAARYVLANEITLGALLAIQYILGQLNVPLLAIAEFFHSAQDARITLNRLAEVHGNTTEEGEATTRLTLPTAKSLHLEQVSFQYEGPASRYVLQNVDITILEGKVTAIVGTSGSGKTTLLKLLLKFYQPQGRITVGNLPLTHINSSYWWRQCGVVMQDGFIFDDTIQANITESDSEHPLNQERLYHATELAHLTETIEQLPLGYQTKIGAGGMQLSGGQRQRVLLARAIYKNPTYLFLDEATSALDANSEHYIINNLENFYQGRTVVIVAHRLSTVKHADQIIVLESGNVVESGTHSELTYQKGRYYELVKNQLELG